MSLVCVVDDDPAVRKSYARIFKSAHLPVEVFGSARDYLSRPQHEGPSCLILDLKMPEIDGMTLHRNLPSTGVQVVFVTGHGDVRTCASAMKDGAVDFLTKPVDADDLIAAAHGALVRSAQLRAQKVESENARRRLGRLTPRERDVLRLVIAGLLNKQIAGQLGAAEKTVKIHRGRVMAKMGVTSVAGLLRIAQAAGVSPAQKPE